MRRKSVEIDDAFEASAAKKEILAIRGDASLGEKRGAHDGESEDGRKRKEAMRSMRWLMCDGVGGAEAVDGG